MLLQNEAYSDLIGRDRSGFLIPITVDVRLHDLVEIRFVDHSAGLGAFGLLLQILTEEVEIELAFLDLGAGL